MLVSLEALRFCFSEVFLVIDVPHAAPGGRRELLASKKGRRAVEKAEAAAKGAADLLGQRCRGTGAPQVLDYDSPELREAVLKEYSDPKGVPDPLHLEPPKRAVLENPKTWIYGHMYKTAMSTDALLRWPGSRYIFHADADMVVRRIEDGDRKADRCRGLGFIETALSLMRSDGRVYSASPCIARFDAASSRYETTPEGKPFQGQWPGGEALADLFNVGESRLYQSFMDTQCFLLDVERFRGLFPLSFPREAAEVLWSHALNKRPAAAYQVKLDAASVGVFYEPAGGARRARKGS